MAVFPAVMKHEVQAVERLHQPLKVPLVVRVLQADADFRQVGALVFRQNPGRFAW